MVKNYILQPYQVVSLFCRMVAKDDKELSAEDIEGKKAILDRKLDRYSSNARSKEFSKGAFGVIEKEHGSDGEEEVIYSTALKDFAGAIHRNTSWAISEKKLELILDYLDDLKSKDLYDEADEKTTLREPKNQILRQVGDATWFLYYRNSRTEFNEDVLNPIVRRVVLHLKDNFKTMSIYNVSIDTRDVTTNVLYEGRYYVRGNRYLFVEGRVSNERELRIIFDTNLKAKLSDRGETILGYYLNASSNVYFGPIVIERVDVPIPKKEQSFEYKIFTREKQIVDGEQIPPMIWNVLSKEYRGSLAEALQ